MRSIYLVLMMICFFGCSQKEISQNQKVFHYNQPNPITSLDPAFAKSQNNIWAVNHIFNGLVQLDDDLNLIPSVSKSWELSDDALVYTFVLRDDVYFHASNDFVRTNPVNAYDVKYSFERLISADLNAAGSWIFQGKVREIDPFIARNDTLFEIHLEAPFNPMLNILSMQYCSILPREYEGFDPQFISRNPIGTGPYKFKRWIENQGLYLVKNDDYFERSVDQKLPYMDGVKASFIGDKKIAFLELLNGKLDAVSGLESSFINELLDMDGNLLDKQKSKIDFYKNPYLNFEYLGINLQSFDQNHPLHKKEVRQALNYAIDRVTMLRSIRNNIGKAANAGVIPRGLPSHNPNLVKGYEYNIQKADSLLRIAGYPSGKGIEPLVIYTNQDYLDMTTIIAKQWEKLGLSVNIELLESATLREKMRKGELGIFRASWIADYPDGESFLTMFYSHNPAPPNYTRFQNDNFDKLYELSIKETKLDKRIAFYQQMDRLVIEEAPVMFLFYDEVAFFSKKGIKGLSHNALNLLQVKNIYEE